VVDAELDPPRGKLAIVSGANRGLGLEIARQLVAKEVHVWIGSRELAQGRAAAGSLGTGRATAVQLDVTNPRDLTSLATRAAKEKGIDIVVANAGIAMDGFNADVAEQTVRVNFFGVLDLVDALLPQVRAHGRIVLMSSGMGDRSNLRGKLRTAFERELSRDELVGYMEKFVADVKSGIHQREGWPSSAYSVSKVGVTALASTLARELEARGNPKGILVNAACPGWVRTDMGGESAPLGVEQGADTPVWLATGLPDGGPTGALFRDRAAASW
jgi:carbonyl reductase 1